MRKHLIYIVAILAVALMASGIISYNIGRGIAKLQVQEMQDRLDSLLAKQRDAIITKRVSLQMEDIAYQQKEISDKQRERAEQQSILALKNAARAEQESQIARKAEAQAKKAEAQAREAAKEAREQKQIAEEQEKIAILQRDEAEHARRLSDTLTYRRLGNTLGASSISQFDSQGNDIASLLAYWSWYFQKEYDGNTYFTQTYLSLAMSSNSTHSVPMPTNSSANAIVPYKDGCLVASGYGEIMYWGNTQEVLFRNNTYDFRGIAVVGDQIYALSHKGQMIILEKSGKAKVIQVPVGNYQKVLKYGSDLLLVAQQSISTFNTTKCSVTYTFSTKDRISSTHMVGEKICIFFNTGMEEHRSMDGKLLAQNNTKKITFLGNAATEVTASLYDPITGCTILGQRDGTIDIYNKYGRMITNVTGHKGAITALTMSGNILVSCSYDHSIQISNLPNFHLDNGYSFMEETTMETVVPRKITNKLEREWVIPVNIKYEGWPLSVTSTTGNLIYVGLSNGNIVSLNTSTDEMAAIIKNNLVKKGLNLTRHQWNYYIGHNVPYKTID